MRGLGWMRVVIGLLTLAEAGWAGVGSPSETTTSAEPSTRATSAQKESGKAAGLPGPELVPVRALADFAGKHCLACHSSRELKGGFDMEDLLAQDTVGKNPAAWHAVLERVVSRDMPPTDHKIRPTEEEYRASEDWLRGQLHAHEALAAINRPRPMRRLNRDEYNRSIESVFGIPGLRPADDFPPDDAVDGFTNIGEGLNLSVVLVEQYLAAGAAIARLAVTEGPAPPSRKRVFSHGNKDYAHSLRGHDPGGAVHGEKWVGDHLFAAYGRAPAGVYRVALLATPRSFAQRPGYVPNFQYRAGKRLVFQADMAVRDGVEFRQEFLVTWPEDGNLELDMRWVNGFPNNNGLRAAGLPIEGKSGKGKKSLAGVAYVVKDWEEERKKNPAVPYPFPYFEKFRLEIEGPLFPEGYPLTRFQRENAAAIAARDATAVANWLLPRLYRRPAKAEEIAEFAAFVTRSEKLLAEAKPTPLPEAQRFPEALRMAIAQALVSPNFLFLVEPGPAGRPLSDHELAVRLAYFLWSAPPDEPLRRLADAGQLRQKLQEQTRRMLADRRSTAFVTRFTSEWLGLDRLATIMPEPELYPRFDKQGLLRQDMAGEPLAVMEYLLRENRPLTELLDADYTFLNDRLADHYHLPSWWSVVPLERQGFAPIGGGEFRKVTLPDGRRGGLVTMAAFLATASENSRTSPVRRGAWILERLFNRPPPPPPPNVNGVLPDTNAGTTVAEKLKLHRNAPNCAGCHSRFDPLGTALENYDVIGEWRDREPPHIDPASPVANLAAVRQRLQLKKYDPLPTYPIDTSFSLGGVQGQGPAAVKAYLLANKDKFARGFTEKLASYALGRRPLITDEPELEAIRTASARDGFRFQSLILSLVQSRLFQSH